MTNRGWAVWCTALIVGGIGTAEPSGTARAATISFDGGANTTKWQDARNWSNDRVPTRQDYVILSNEANVTISQPGATTRYLDVYGGSVLDVTGGDLTFGNGGNRWMWIGYQTPGTVNQYGGTVEGLGTNVDLIVDRYGRYNMFGGSLVVPDDFFLFDSSIINLVGPVQIAIGDELRTDPQGQVTINVELVGDQLPVISIADTLQLSGRVALNIDAMRWTGSSNVSLFRAAHGITGTFSDVTINGLRADASQYSLGSDAVVVSVNEPASMALPGTVGFLAFVLLLPRMVGRSNRKVLPPTMHETLPNWTSIVARADEATTMRPLAKPAVLPRPAVIGAARRIHTSMRHGAQESSNHTTVAT